MNVKKADHAKNPNNEIGIFPNQVWLSSNGLRRGVVW